MPWQLKEPTVHVATLSLVSFGFGSSFESSRCTLVAFGLVFHTLVVRRVDGTCSHVESYFVWSSSTDGRMGEADLSLSWLPVSGYSFGLALDLDPTVAFGYVCDWLLCWFVVG